MTTPVRPKGTTLHDVAREAGVSLITASRALSKPDVVSSKTIAKVQKAVEATGYIPNMLAGGLKSKRSLMVAGVVPALSVSQFLPTLQTLTTTLSQAGYQLILGQTNYDAAQEESVLNTLISRQPDGIVITGLVQSERARDRLKRSGIPVVETWDLTPTPVDMVIGFSHQAVGQKLGEYFATRGWQHVGIATGNDHRALLRRDGFIAAFGRDVPTALVPAPSSLALGRQALRDLLQADPRIEAICCSSDQLANGVLVEAQARGLRVPQDLAICGFGNADFAAHMFPSITTVHVDGPEIGRVAARLIIDRCDDVPLKHAVIDLGFRLIERQSTQA